jgi:hypothetical protein
MECKNRLGSWAQQTGRMVTGSEPVCQKHQKNVKTLIITDKFSGKLATATPTMATI